MTDIAIYVQTDYAKKTYAVESYNVRAWPGMETIRDALERGGNSVAYCGKGNVQEYKIILVSITSAVDWYSFIAERVTWVKGDYIVICGGAGVLNIIPLLQYADIFIFGRGENIICNLIATLLNGDRMIHPSIVYNDSFDISNVVRLNQADRAYPYSVKMANDKIYNEVSIGCQRRCLFCGYTWQRKHIGGNQILSGAASDIWGTSTESTFFELDLNNPNSWDLPNGYVIMGLDGYSERLRMMVNKPITREMFVKFLIGVCTKEQPKRYRLYNIVGYPTETDEDYYEFADVMLEVNARCSGKILERRGINYHDTPFRPMPVTPAATWKCSYVDYRSRRHIEKMSSRNKVITQYDKNIPVINGDFWCSNDGTIDSLASVILDMLILRGAEQDVDTIRMISITKKFWGSNSAKKLATLGKYVDVDRLFKEYTWNELPTRYLEGYVTNESLRKIGEYRMNKYGLGLTPEYPMVNNNSHSIGIT